jgi:hypothetical protein
MRRTASNARRTKVSANPLFSVVRRMRRSFSLDLEGEKRTANQFAIIRGLNLMEHATLATHATQDRALVNFQSG